MDPVKLSVIFYEDGDLWVAQAIEFDIAARAAKPSQLPRAFERALVANLSVNHELGRAGLERIGPAPREFQAMFESARLSLSERDGPMPAPRGFEIGDVRLAESA